MKQIFEGIEFGDGISIAMSFWFLLQIICLIICKKIIFRARCYKLIDHMVFVLNT